MLLRLLHSSRLSLRLWHSACRSHRGRHVEGLSSSAAVPSLVLLICGVWRHVHFAAVARSLGGVCALANPLRVSRCCVLSLWTCRNTRGGHWRRWRGALDFWTDFSDSVAAGLESLLGHSLRRRRAAAIRFRVSAFGRSSISCIGRHLALQRGRLTCLGGGIIYVRAYVTSTRKEDQIGGRTGDVLRQPRVAQPGSRPTPRHTKHVRATPQNGHRGHLDTRTRHPSARHAARALCAPSRHARGHQGLRCAPRAPVTRASPASSALGGVLELATAKRPEAGAAPPQRCERSAGVSGEASTCLRTDETANRALERRPRGLREA